MGKIKKAAEEIQHHRAQVRASELMSGKGPERRPPVNRKYEPAKMPKDADIDAALAKIRANRLTASARELKPEKP